jgi:hypothetical protein
VGDDDVAPDRTPLPLGTAAQSVSAEIAAADAAE